MSCFDAQRCVVVAEGGGSAKILTTSNGGEDWRETLQPSSGSLMSVQCMEDGEAWAGGGVLGVRPPPFPPPRPARPLLRSRLTRRHSSQFPTFTAHYWHTTDYGESWHLHEMEGACETSTPFAPPSFGRLKEAAVQTHLTSASHLVKRRWASPPSSPQAFRGLRVTRTEGGRAGVVFEHTYLVH